MWQNSVLSVTPHVKEQTFLRILHLVHQYAPDFVGGTELYTEKLALSQAKAGHHVAVFTPAPSADNQGETTAVVEQGVRVYREPVGSRSRIRVFSDSFHQADLRKAWEKVLAQEAPDIVHIQHLMGMPLGLVNHLLEAEVPYVVTLHDYWYACANAQLLTNTEHTICNGPDRWANNCARCAIARAGRRDLTWMSPTLAPLMRYRNSRLRHALTHAGRIIAPTDFVALTYQSLGIPNTSMEVIRHGIDVPDRIVSPGKQGGHPFHIGYVGSISRQKGVHVLIEAVNKMQERNIRLTIYGDFSAFPEYGAALANMVRHPGITLAGAIDRQQLWPALAEFDVIVLPTLWYETSSLVLDEAFALNVPVVASRIGVMPEKITDSVDGRLFPAGDADALRTILLELLENPEKLQLWRARIPPVRTSMDNAQDVEAVYASVINRRHRKPISH